MFDAAMEGSGELDASKPYEPSSNHVRFFRKGKLNQKKTEEAGRPIFDMVDRIEIISPGDKTNIVEKWATDEHRREYRAVYLAYLADQNQDAASGTLLSAWGGLSPERLEEFHYGKVVTCEQLAAMPDANLERFGPMTTAERAKAREYIAAMKGASPVMKMRAEIEEKDARLAVLEEAVSRLLASSGSAQANAYAQSAQAVAPKTEPVKEAAKPKRGRPPKKGTNESQV